MNTAEATLWPLSYLCNS